MEAMRGRRLEAHASDKLSLLVSMVNPWLSRSFRIIMAAAPASLAASILSMKLQSVRDPASAVSASSAAARSTRGKIVAHDQRRRQGGKRLAAVGSISAVATE